MFSESWNILFEILHKYWNYFLKFAFMAHFELEKLNKFCFDIKSPSVILKLYESLNFSGYIKMLIYNYNSRMFNL